MSPSKRTPLLVNDPLTLGTTFKTTTVKAQGQPTWSDSLKWLLFGSQLNTLLLTVPLAAIADYLDCDPQLRFGFSLIAIVSLAKHLPSYLRRTPRALLGTAFANAVELIVGLVALFHGQIRIVQTIMLGSVLSNFSFILTAFFVGMVISWPRNRACSCHPYAAASGLKAHRCECKTWLTTQTFYLWRGSLMVPTTLFIARPTSWSSTEACPDEPFQDRKDTPEMSAAAASLAHLSLGIVTVLIPLARNSLETGNTGGTLSLYIGLMLLPFLSKVSGHIASSVGTNHTILFTAGLVIPARGVESAAFFSSPGHELSLAYKKCVVYSLLLRLS
ncbi:hypothetical protein EDB92DRAFT_1819454 [Lactarius akahatsu]|uniref:Sodium/calcium exchanger membrane region domain-containing protein n=1 Tax=Lactarius akahatsu TaxID=416441 RepID=A0AAD4L897_9AGAM|nr:hypothetical protein EDB92DRAFT_1819454 [Lactarius akahatsu]